MPMHTKTLTVRFLTPAFLGDAEQRSAWRTPPFKAQLRQWWRLVLATRGWDWRQIRTEETELFGNAGETARKSQIRLRLGKWGADSKQTWSGNQIQRRPANGNMDALVYLGYGRVDRSPQSKPAIDAGETAELRIAWPAGTANGADHIEEALALMSRFGTVGGRSRNGWGSYVLDGAGDAVWTDYLIDWHKALDADWVRGIGCDERGPLIWRTRDSWKNWDEALRQLAGVRATIARESGEDRCLLSYPVTRHNLPPWGAKERLPNSLRFKVVKDVDGHLRGEVAHFPCRPSDTLWESLRQPDKKERLHAVWADAHEYLDEEKALERVSA